MFTRALPVTTGRQPISVDNRIDYTAACWSAWVSCNSGRELPPRWWGHVLSRACTEWYAFDSHPLHTAWSKHWILSCSICNRNRFQWKVIQTVQTIVLGNAWSVVANLSEHIRHGVRVAQVRLYRSVVLGTIAFHYRFLNSTQTTFRAGSEAGESPVILLFGLLVHFIDAIITFVSELTFKSIAFTLTIEWSALFSVRWLLARTLAGRDGQHFFGELQFDLAIDGTSSVAYATCHIALGPFPHDKTERG